MGSVSTLLVHVDEEDSQPLVFFARGVGSGYQETPVGVMRITRPDFLAVDDPFVAVSFRTSRQARHVGAGFGLEYP